MHEHEKLAPDNTPDSDAPQAKPDAESGGEVLDILAQFETQMNRLREAQHEHHEQVSALEVRVAAVAAQEQGAEQLRCDIEAKQQTLLTERAQFEERAGQLEPRIAEFEAQRIAFEESRQRQREEIRSLSERLEEERTVLSELEHELVERRRAFETERTQSEEQRQQRAQEFEAQRLQEDDRLTKAQAEIDQQQARSRELEAQLEKAHQDIQTRETLLDEMRHEYQLEYDRLIQQNEEQRQQHASAASDLQSRVARAVAEAADTAEQAGQLRRQLDEKTRGLDSAEEQRGQLREQIELLRKDLENSAGGADEASAAREQYLADLTERLEQAQTEGAELQRRVEQAEKNVGELVSKLEQAHEELERKQRELDEARHETEALRSRVEQLSKDLEQRGDVDGEALAERDTRITELTAQIEQLGTDLEQRGASADASELADRDARIAKLTAQVQKLQTDSSGSADAKAKIKELETKLAAATAAAGKSGGADPAAAERLKSKAKKLSAAAEHLRRRHKRLRGLKKGLRALKRGGSLSGSKTERMAHRQKNDAEVRKVQQERFELTELRKMLASSETKMVRRWARQKAVVTLGWILLMGVVVAVGSWFGTDLLFPRQVSASVTVAAKTRDGTSLSEAEAQGWKHWHTEILAYDLFHKQLAKRLTDRQLKDYASAPLAGRRLAKDLTIDAAVPERLTLTLAGTDRGEVMYFLDTVATTLSIESGREITKRDDDARAAILGEHQKNGRIAYATLNPVPTTQEHLIKVGIVFAVGMSLTIVIVGFIYTRLTRAKRVFDEDEFVEVEVVMD